MLATLWPQIAAVDSITTTPDGANVAMQEFGATDGRWRSLGRTPIRKMRLPRGVLTFRVEKEGDETLNLAARNPGSLLQNFGLQPIQMSLLKKGEAPEMVPVPGGFYPVSLTGFNVERNLRVDGFLIDRHEVTNREYMAFVDGRPSSR